LETSFPANHLPSAKMVLTNHLAGTSKTSITTIKWQHKKPKQQLTKTTNISKTKPDETKAWFRAPFTASGQETDWAFHRDLLAFLICSTTTFHEILEITVADRVMNPLHLGVIRQIPRSGSVWIRIPVAFGWGSQNSMSQVHLALVKVWSLWVQSNVRIVFGMNSL